MKSIQLGKATLGVAAAALLASGSAVAGDVMVGEVSKNGMNVAAVYIQPTMMEPKMPGMGASDIHLEADISAEAGNPHGFAEGSWVPYLGITYVIRKQGSDWSTLGELMPMIASDGPHYAANIKLNGPGKYTLSYHITPPPYQGFYRHVDKETGVDAWWAPLDLSWEFAYVGTGKKGGY